MEGSSQNPLVIVGLGCPALDMLPARGLTSLNLAPKLIRRSSLALTSAELLLSSKSSTGTSSAGIELVTLLESELMESARGRVVVLADMDPRRRVCAAARAMGEL